MSDPVRLGFDLFRYWEENCRDLHADGPFGPDEADWPSLCGFVFHEVILPLSLVAGAEDSLRFLPDRPCEAEALRILQRLPAQTQTRDRGRGIGTGAAILPRALRSVLRLRRRVRAQPGLLAICENAQAARDGGDPFYSGLLPEGTRRCWLKVRGGRAPAADLCFDDAMLRAALGPVRRFARKHRTFLQEGCQALARRIQIPGLAGGAGLTALVGEQIAQTLRYHVHARHAARMLLEAARPSRVLMYAEYASTQYMLLCEARRLGIGTVAIQHGDIVDELSPGFLHPLLEDPLRPDLTLVSGPALREECLRAGYPEDAVRVTGQLWRGLARRRPQRDPGGPVLIFSQSFLSSACRARFFASLRQLRGARLQIKLHPYERHGLVAQHLPPGCEVLPAEIPAFVAMDGKAAVVGGSTTGLLEAWSMGLPVLSIESASERIRHEDLRAVMPRVPAGADPSEALQRVLDAGPLDPGPIARYFIPEPDPQEFLRALES